MSRWKRRFVWQLHVFTKEIGFCESFLHVCRLNPVKGAMAGDVFENLEIATDTARLGAAKTVGDVETRRVCEQILPQEQAMADWLLAHLHELTEGFLARDASPGVTAKK